MSNLPTVSATRSLHRLLILYVLSSVCFLFLVPTVFSLAAVANNMLVVCESPCYICFDFGTSGARISVIQQQQQQQEEEEEEFSSLSSLKEIYSQSVPWSDDNTYDDPQAWMDAAIGLLQSAVKHLNQHHPHQASSVASICVSGTSASCLMIDTKKNAGKVTRKPRMYDYNVVLAPTTTRAQHQSNSDSSCSTTTTIPIPIHGVRAMQLLEQYAPACHTTRSPTSSLTKLLTWNEEQPLSSFERLCHQSDYIALQFMSEPKQCGAGPKNHRIITSDWQNCLKLGYDVQNLQWPDWLNDCLRQGANIDPTTKALPDRVVSPGEPIGTISSHLAQQTGLSKSTVIVGGTTDSNAAFFAAAYGGSGSGSGSTGGSWQPGIAVTSLGSTLAIKQLSHKYVEDATVGVYSHRFPSVLRGTTGKTTRAKGSEEPPESVAWLVGGASNVGCAILRKLSFSNQELEELSQQIDPNIESPLSYYPLTKKGERFPVADSNKEPLLEPVPPERNNFLHGILQSISTVECQGFLALAERGAELPKTVYTAGGGARNDMWSRMRQRRLREAFAKKSGTANEVIVKRAANSEASFGAAILAAAHQLHDNNETS